MRIAILGGSFDPIHRGHIAMAQSVLAQDYADKVIFMPAAQAPLKPGAPGAPGQDRVDLVEAAIAALKEPRFEVSRLEVDAGGVNYTAHTVSKLLGKNELFWIIGADQAAQLTEWKDIETLVSNITFLAFKRGEEDIETPDIEGLKLIWVKAAKDAVSSTEIRKLISEGQPYAFYLPDGVSEIIQSRGLY